MTKGADNSEVVRTAIPNIRHQSPRIDGVNDPIGAGLRKLWADIEQEPVPDEFLNLLDQIDTARAHGKTGPDESPA